MERVKIPDINLTSDSEDLIDDYWFTSPSASFDGSSVNSIPWAEDAEDVVKQNQELWERVERMFYGEESLPINDVKLRNEVIEWTEHFPYLRVSGKQVPIYFSDNVIPNNPNFKEILAIHPPSVQKSSAIGADRSLRSHDDSLADDMEKCLRITSGPLLSRRAQNSRTAYGSRSIIASNPTEQNFGQATKYRNKQGFKSALVSVRSNYDIGAQFARKLYGSIDVVPYSARIIKIPSLKSDLSTLSTTKPSVIRIKTAALVPISRPLRNSITLPAINIVPKYLDHAISSETAAAAAAAALIHQNASTKILHSPQKIMKKRSESE